MKNAVFLMAGALAFLSACRDKEKPASEPARIGAASGSAAFASPEAFKSALAKVFEGYIGIQTALAQDDLPKAKEALSPMHAVLHSMPKEGLDSAAMAYWDSADAKIMDALHPMASSDDIDSVRAHFKSFSEAMIDVSENFGPAGTATVYQFHCPMADGNQGADWLQRERELANPYFGKSMLRCGSMVREWGG